MPTTASLFARAFAANATRQSANNDTYITCGAIGNVTRSCAALLGHDRGGCYLSADGFPRHAAASLAVCTCHVRACLSPTSLTREPCSMYSTLLTCSRPPTFSFPVVPVEQVFTGLTPADGGWNATYAYGPNACQTRNWVNTFSLVVNIPTTLFCLGVLLFTLVTLFKVVRSGAMGTNVTSSTLCWTAGAATFNFAWYVGHILCLPVHPSRYC